MVKTTGVILKGPGVILKGQELVAEPYFSLPGISSSR